MQTSLVFLHGRTSMMQCKKIIVYYIYPTIDTMSSSSSSMLSSNTTNTGNYSEETLFQKYTNALNRYYQLKSRYQNEISSKKNAIRKATKSNRERRDMFRKFTPPCVSCGRKVGSTFTITSETEVITHIAKCGDTQNPCQLDIKLITGVTIDLRKERAEQLNTLNTYGTNVIRLTNDGMFGYITSDAVVDTHDAYEEDRLAQEKVQLKRDNLINLRQDVSEIETAYNNSSRLYNKDNQIRIHTKTDLLNEHISIIKSNMTEYKRTGNKQFLRDSVHLNIHEMRENIDSLNRDKYARMAVERRDKPTTYILYQETATINSWTLPDYEPQVVQFSIGKKLSIPEKKVYEEEFVPPSIPGIGSSIAVPTEISSDATKESVQDNDVEPTIPIDLEEMVLPEQVDSDAESEAESDAESEEDEDEPLPRIHIGETVDTSSDDGFVPPPPAISDIELSSSDDGFVPPPPPIEEMEDSSSDGFVPPPPPIEDLENSSEA